MRARFFLMLLPLLAPFLAAGIAVAQPSGAQPLDRLLPQIRRNVPGQFLDAEGASNGSDPHYHLKWLTPDGRVMWLDADARTGRVLRQAPGRDSFDTQRPRGDAQVGPLDRREEGRSTNPRDDRQDQPRFDTRRQYRQPDSNSGEDRGGPSRAERNFGNGFERGPGGNDNRYGGRDFGGGSGRDFGNRSSGGGRDRRGDGR